jgi:metal-responsive CopG/Arc/MetJ family transcriptional regulator
MGAPPNGARKTKTVSCRINEDIVDRVDKEIMKLQVQDELSMDFSRSDVIRAAIYHVVENPEDLKEVEETIEGFEKNYD